MSLVRRPACFFLFLFIVLLGLGAVGARAQDDDAAPAKTAAEEPFRSDPKFDKAYQEARHGRMTQEDRLSAWKQTNKLSGNRCVECLRHTVKIQMALGQYKDATKTAAVLEGLATEPNDKAYAQYMHGASLFHMNGDKPKPQQLAEAEADFQAVLVMKPKEVSAMYLDGRALAMEKKDAEAKAMFQRYLDTAKYSDKLRTRVEHFVANPELAAMPMAPPFTVTTNDGEQFTLDEMNGRVVLVDFWATWCGPCNEELPTMRRIAKEFAGQPLVVISVSWDDDANKWRQFIEKEKMTWPQYRDSNHTLSTAYGVDAIPHYFTIDSDGVLKSEMLGSGNDVIGTLRKLVAKAKDAEKKKAMESDKPAAGQ